MTPVPQNLRQRKISEKLFPQNDFILFFYFFSKKMQKSNSEAEGVGEVTSPPRKDEGFGPEMTSDLFILYCACLMSENPSLSLLSLSLSLSLWIHMRNVEIMNLVIKWLVFADDVVLMSHIY